jgi:hypothetical protein
MTTARMALDQVAQRIAQQEAELKSLQKEYRVRTRRLDQLNRRKRQLQAQLDQIEGRIQALNGAETAPPATAKAAALPDQPRKNVRRRSAKKKKAGSLAQFLLTVLREAGKPLSNQELTEEVRRRKFPTQAGDLPKLVATRVWALVKKGYLQRTPDHKIVAANGRKAAPRPQAASPTAKARSSTKAAAKPTPPKPSKSRREQPSLQAVLTRILQKSDQPVPGSELARRVLATGYESQSKDFTNLIWVTLGRMDNVENTKGQGYRLKKR